MSEPISFKIQDRQFLVPANYREINKFTVQSVPRPYFVRLEEGDATTAIAKLMTENPRNLLLIDRTVLELYKNRLPDWAGRVFPVEANEEAKTLAGAMKFVDFLLEQKFSRGETVAVVGGGVVQDIAAFACAVYKRGVPWTYFPTTLLAMCDSCIGAKTGINYRGVKNILALFSAPREVRICPEFLQTLPEREYHAGLGEILKLHVTGGRLMLKHYTDEVSAGRVKNQSSFKKLILGALMVKKAVIEADEFELSLRRAMNYGHTLGHAIEVLSNHRVPHGQAVAIGIILANDLSLERGFLSQADAEYLHRLALDLLDEGIHAAMRSLSTERLPELLAQDKKSQDGTANFIIIKAPGETEFLPLALSPELIAEILQIVKKFFNEAPHG